NRRWRRRSSHFRGTDNHSGSRQRRFHHGNQRVGRNEWLLQNAVRAHPLRFLLVQRVERADQQNDGNVGKGRVLLYVVADFIAVADRHENVRQDQVGPHIGNLAYRSFAISDGYNVNALILQGQAHHLLDVAVVIRNQDLGHRTSSEGTHTNTPL